MSGLQQSAVPAASDRQIGFGPAQICQMPVKVPVRWQRFDPLLPDLLPIEHGLEGERGLFCMRPGLIDHDHDLVDFHRRLTLDIVFILHYQCLM